jgi:GMP synthase (glutamine-hydrolysing)
MKLAVAIRHVSFEDLGNFGPVLAARGFEVRYVDCGTDDVAAIDPFAPDLLIVLGGPIGAYEDDLYPFIKDEVWLLEQRLTAPRATLGVCLGAQMIARTLGARVYPAPHKEIGWSRLMLTAAGSMSPLRHLKSPVLHWHGDTFDLPREATLLASTEKCVNQAFSWGDNVLALQFHPEAVARNIEQWFIGHACEISATDGISVPVLRRDTHQFAAGLELEAARCLADWLDTIDLNEVPIVTRENGSAG